MTRGNPVCPRDDPRGPVAVGGRSGGGAISLLSRAARLADEDRRGGRLRSGTARRGGGVRRGFGVERAQRPRAEPRAYVRAGALRKPGRPDDRARRAERHRGQGRLHRPGVGAVEEGGHDLQRLEDLPLHGRRSSLRQGAHRLGRRPGGPLHARRRTLRFGTQRVHHLGPPAPPDERLAGDALRKARLGRPAGGRSPLRVPRPSDVQAGNPLTSTTTSG